MTDYEKARAAAELVKAAAAAKAAGLMYAHLTKAAQTLLQEVGLA